MLKVIEDVVALRGVAGEVGIDVAEDWLCIEVVLNNLGYVAVNHFVVGHPGADGINKQHITGGIGAHEPRYT